MSNITKTAMITVCGRPNVGKSMLFNKLVGQRLSIVEDTPGVTRDRIYGSCEWCGRTFSLVDTGGIEPNTDNEILAFMRQQAQIAIDNATVIVLVTDIKTGMTAADQEVAGMLQRLLHIQQDEMPKFMDATDALGAAYCHFLQMGRPETDAPHYSSWKDFAIRNRGKASTTDNTLTGPQTKLLGALRKH